MTGWLGAISSRSSDSGLKPRRAPSPAGRNVSPWPDVTQPGRGYAVWAGVPNISLYRSWPSLVDGGSPTRTLKVRSQSGDLVVRGYNSTGCDSRDVHPAASPIALRIQCSIAGLRPSAASCWRIAFTRTNPTQCGPGDNGAGGFVSFSIDASRSCPVRSPAWDATWSPVAVQRSQIAPRQHRLRRLGLVAP